jgi:hypothetical protein
MPVGPVATTDGEWEIDPTRRVSRDITQSLRTWILSLGQPEPY